MRFLLRWYTDTVATPNNGWASWKAETHTDTLPWGGTAKGMVSPLTVMRGWNYIRNMSSCCLGELECFFFLEKGVVLVFVFHSFSPFGSLCGCDDEECKCLIHHFYFAFIVDLWCRFCGTSIHMFICLFTLPLFSLSCTSCKKKKKEHLVFLYTSISIFRSKRLYILALST